MSDHTHRRQREMLGAHALGLLEEAETVALRAHLDGCASCRADLADIAPAARALAQADPTRVRAPAAPPPDLGDRILEAVRIEQLAGAPEPRRWVRPLVAAVVVLVLGVSAGYLVGRAGTSNPFVPLEPVAVQVLDPTIEARADVVPHTWGVEIKLNGHGFEPGATYRAVVVDQDGSEVSAGEFIGTGPTDMSCNLNSSVLRADAASFRITDATGTPVIVSQL